jgi:hypothetical protein
MNETNALFRMTLAAVTSLLIYARFTFELKVAVVVQEATSFDGDLEDVALQNVLKSINKGSHL